jgi:hypothetical protein
MKNPLNFHPYYVPLKEKNKMKIESFYFAKKIEAIVDYASQLSRLMNNTYNRTISKDDLMQLKTYLLDLETDVRYVKKLINILEQEADREAPTHTP